MLRIRLLLILFTIVLYASCRGASNKPPVGEWDASVVTPSGGRVDFRLRLEATPSGMKGLLVNGDESNESTSGSFDGNVLRLGFDYYDAKLEATLRGDQLEGSFTRQWRHETLARSFAARRAQPRDMVPAGEFSRFKGNWVIRVTERGKEQLSELSLTEGAGEIRATVMSLSGDWGTFTGRIEKGDLVLTRFDGINARLLRARQKDDQIEGIIDMGTRVAPVEFKGERANAANLSNLPDPATATRMRNRSEPFHFSFVDFDGNLLASTDSRFTDKVVIVTITGSWCPNCHDEAPFLQELYDRYHGQGLEIIGLAFEYTGDAGRDAEQVRSFARRHRLTFPILLAGTTDEGDLLRKLPQIENFSGYPTTIYIGRDGLVKHIHAGFEGRATGERFTRLKVKIEETVKSLLAE
ncbi:MAG: TlpA disulfide reductase family protein [Acidobacteriota bacterium]